MHETRLFLELLRNIRGHRSQHEINKKFGYVANQVSQWELGRRNMSWRRFTEYCSYCNRDLPAALEAAVGYEGEKNNLRALLLHLTGTKRDSEVASACGYPRVTVYRWLRGMADPSAEKIISLIQSRSAQAFEIFLKTIVRDPVNQGQQKGTHVPHTDRGVPISSPSQARSAFSDKGLGQPKRNNNRENVPYVTAFAAALQSQVFQKYIEKATGYLASKLGLPTYAEKQSLKVFKDRGWIQWEQKGNISIRHHGPWTISDDPRWFLAHQRFWLSHTLSDLQGCTTMPADFKVFAGHYAVSKHTQQELISYLKKAQQDVMQIVTKGQLVSHLQPLTELVFVEFLVKGAMKKDT